jgi:N-acetylglucosaminyl-diphospho-decaprenol L-rhamnosyltransferase
VGVSVIIPHRNSGPLLDRCLEALERATGIDEVVVADERSTDGSVERASTRPGTRIVDSSGRGVAAAINAGAASASGQWLLLLGSDAFVRPDTADRLRRRLEGDPGLAVCGAALVTEEGRPTKSYQRMFTLGRALIDALGVRPHVPQEGTGLQRVEAVFPNCIAVRREAFEQIGGYDESFVIYYEDMDFCRRLAAAGWQQAIDWEAVATHIGGGSTLAAGPGSWFRRYHQSRLLYLRKHYPRGWLLYVALWAPKAALHAGTWRARALARHLREDAAGEKIARDWAEAFRHSVLPSRSS